MSWMNGNESFRKLLPFRWKRHLASQTNRSTGQESDKGYIWIKYSASYYNQKKEVITASADVISRWSITLQNGEWTVAAIDEMP